jgi:hypothetical protein
VTQSLLVQHQQKLKIKKPKLLRSNPYRFVAIRTWGLDPDQVLVDDDYVLVNSRRIILKIEKSLDDDGELDDYIKLRLFMAREMAMSAYRKTHDSF